MNDVGDVNLVLMNFGEEKAMSKSLQTYPLICS